MPTPPSHHPRHDAAQIIRVSAVVLTYGTSHLLTVRKQGTHRFMFPGGKPDVGETPLETAVRECREELGLALDPHTASWLGSHTAAAANETGFAVEAAVFTWPPLTANIIAALTPQAEIAELRWLPLTTHPWPQDLAPLTVSVAKLLAARGA